MSKMAAEPVVCESSVGTWSFVSRAQWAGRDGATGAPRRCPGARAGRPVPRAARRTRRRGLRAARGEPRHDAAADPGRSRHRHAARPARVSELVRRGGGVDGDARRGRHRRGGVRARRRSHARDGVPRAEGAGGAHRRSIARRHARRHHLSHPPRQGRRVSRRPSRRRRRRRRRRACTRRPRVPRCRRGSRTSPRRSAARSAWTTTAATAASPSDGTAPCRATAPGRRSSRIAPPTGNTTRRSDRCSTGPTAARSSPWSRRTSRGTTQRRRITIGNGQNLKLDPALFRPPPRRCEPDVTGVLSKSLEHRNTLHFNPLHHPRVGGGEREGEGERFGRTKVERREFGPIRAERVWKFPERGRRRAAAGGGEQGRE